jgi:serine/threonine protein kinase
LLLTIFVFSLISLFFQLSRIIHRDLKSPNILIDSADRAKIGDLGMAESLEEARLRDLQDQNIPRQAHSQPLSTIGSMPWMAPELRTSTSDAVKVIPRGHPDWFFSADVYSYGVILFEIWTGHCIMEHISATAPAGSTGARLRKSASSDSFDSIIEITEQHSGSLDSEIYSLIKSCCARVPQKRRSMRIVFHELRSCFLKLGR